MRQLLCDMQPVRSEIFIAHGCTARSHTAMRKHVCQWLIAHAATLGHGLATTPNRSARGFSSARKLTIGRSHATQQTWLWTRLRL